MRTARGRAEVCDRRDGGHDRARTADDRHHGGVARVLIPTSSNERVWAAVESPDPTLRHLTIDTVPHTAKRAAMSIPERPALEGLEAKWGPVWESEGTHRFHRDAAL